MSSLSRTGTIRRRVRRALRTVLWVALIEVCLAGTGAAQDRTGRILGHLFRHDGSGVSGATVVLNETGATDFTRTNGQFTLGNVPPGTYSITLTLGTNVVTVTAVHVEAGVATTLDQVVDWESSFAETLVVRGASRQMENIVGAPVAATLVSEADIERDASSGEVATLLEFTPGAQVTRGGLWDFNMGTRGFNRALSRRVGVRLDGHDLALPFFGYQGWPLFSFPLDDLSTVEIVRGPSAALYGANATGGVLNMTSKEPRFSRGGMLRVTFGQLDTANVEGRWAGSLGRGWYARAVGGIRRSDGFAVSRVNGPEYSTPCKPGTFGDCLPAEIVPFDNENTQIFFGGIRLDKYFAGDLMLTVEAGHTEGEFGVFQVVGQRAKSLGRDGKRPWARFDLKSRGFNVAGSYDGYVEPSGYVGLTTGTQFNSDSYRWQLEGQANRSLHQDRIQLVTGATAWIERMDSYNPAVGGQTFLFRPISSNSEAVFGQGTWNLSRQLKIIGAARGDWSSLYEFQFSPRGSVIYTFSPAQSLRVSYNQAFQVSNSLEYFLQAPVAPPVDLSALNGFCAPSGVDCKFGSTPVLALGNEDLKVEKVRTWEAGYKGVFADRALVTIEYFLNRSTNLVTGLLPQLGTALGRLNPNFGPWQAPTGLPPEIADAIRSAVPLLSNLPDGSNILAAASYANFGKTDTQGIDVAVSGLFRAGWRPSVSYSWFDFHIPEGQPDLQGLLLPNTPANSFTAGLGYDHRRLHASADVRWVEGFRWADSFFQGDVKTYTTVDLTATHPVSAHVSVNVNVSNLLDNRHWETFGGALLRRRALAGLQYNW
jgi:outer membrane receptor protein involved in Fe transport